MRVTGLFVYPVKSAGAIALESMAIDAVGPGNDRRFMIVDENGRFVTQREFATVGNLMIPAARLFAVGKIMHDILRVFENIGAQHADADR